MDPSVLEGLVQQATQAEARLSQIESKLKAGNRLPATNVSDLQELRALLVKAKTENEQIKAERDQAVKAAKAADVEVSKLNYRVLHLTRAVRDADVHVAAAAGSS